MRLPDRCSVRVAPSTVIRPMMKSLRISAAVTIACVALAAPLDAQQNLPPGSTYQSIPDFTGTNAGASFRGAINDRFTGVQAITPRVTNQPYSSLPSEQDGLLLFCKDCQQTIPCASGGTGAWAFGQNGVWTCTSPNTAGNVLYQGASGAQLNDLSASLNGTFN